MFYHKACKNTVLIDISGLIQLVTAGGLTKDYIKISVSQIYFKNDIKLQPKWYCPTCSDTLEDKDLFSRCMSCYNDKEISDLYRTTKSGNIVCIDCAKNFYSDEKLKKLPEIISRIEL